MAFHPFEVNAPHLVYAFLGGFVVIVSLPASFFLFLARMWFVVFVPSSTPRSLFSSILSIF